MSPLNQSKTLIYDLYSALEVLKGFCSRRPAMTIIALKAITFVADSLCQSSSDLSILQCNRSMLVQMVIRKCFFSNKKSFRIQYLDVWGMLYCSVFSIWIVGPSTWVFPCKFAAYFQKTFFCEHLWRTTFVSPQGLLHLLYRVVLSICLVKCECYFPCQIVYVDAILFMFEMIFQNYCIGYFCRYFRLQI